jgi:hypothetical protein
MAQASGRDYGTAIEGMQDREHRDAPSNDDDGERRPSIT